MFLFLFWVCVFWDCYCFWTNMIQELQRMASVFSATNRAKQRPAQHCFIQRMDCEASWNLGSEDRSWTSTQLRQATNLRTHAYGPIRIRWVDRQWSTPRRDSCHLLIFKALCGMGFWVIFTAHVFSRFQVVGWFLLSAATFLFLFIHLSVIKKKKDKKWFMFTPVYGDREDLMTFFFFFKWFENETIESSYWVGQKVHWSGLKPGGGGRGRLAVVVSVYAKELFGHPIITLTILSLKEKVSACYDLFWNFQSPGRAGIFVIGFLLD